VKKGDEWHVKQEKTTFFENFFEKICSIQINVLPLHPQIRNDL